MGRLHIRKGIEVQACIVIVFISTQDGNVLHVKLMYNNTSNPMLNLILRETNKWILEL
jgi:hypothetical protein